MHRWALLEVDRKYQPKKISLHTHVHAHTINDVTKKIIILGRKSSKYAIRLFM